MHLAMKSRDIRERAAVRTGQFVSMAFWEKSEIPQEGCMAVPFSAGWGKCVLLLLLLLLPVPHQLQCGTQSTGNQDLCPPALQALGDFTQTHSLESLTTGLTSTSNKDIYSHSCTSATADHSAVVFDELISQGDSFHPCFTWAHSLRQLLSGWWGQAYRSFSHLMLAASSLPFEDAWSRCLMTIYCPPAEVSQTAATDTASSSRSITDHSTSDQRAPSSEPPPPVLRMSQENDPMELRTLVCSYGIARLSPGLLWAQWLQTQITQIIGSCKVISLSSTATGFFLCCTHSRQGLVLFPLPQEIKFIFVTVYLIFCISFRMIVCHSCIPQCKPENHWAMS